MSTRYVVRPERDGTYTVRDTHDADKEVYRTIITGPAARVVAKTVLAHYIRIRP